MANRAERAANVADMGFVEDNGAAWRRLEGIGRGNNLSPCVAS
jgi:hypothetical protein